MAQERKSLYLINEFTLAETQVHRNNSHQASILLMSVYPLLGLLCEKKIVCEILSTINIDWPSLGVGNKVAWPTFSEINVRIHLITNWWSNGNIKQIYYVQFSAKLELDNLHLSCQFHSIILHYSMQLYPQCAVSCAWLLTSADSLKPNKWLELQLP